MKHLLTGVAMAAAFAIAVPAWAQSSAPMTPPASPPKAPGAMPATAPAQPMAKKPMHRMPMHHMAMHHRHWRGMGAGDQMTEDLNKQELARIMGGGAAPAMAPGAMGMPGGNNPTSGSAGPFAPK